MAATSPAVAAPAKVGQPAPEQKVAQGDSLTLLEFSNARWRHNAAPGVTRKDLVHPAYFFAAGDRKLKAFDVIECVAADGKWWAEVLVASAQQAMPPALVELRYVDLSGVMVTNGYDGLPLGYEIRFSPQGNTHAAYRTSDGARMTPELPSREDARRELMNHATLRQVN